MVTSFLALALSFQATPAAVQEQQDQQDQVSDETEKVDPSELRRIFVKDSDQAQRVEIEHPLQQICVRKLVPGSRVKAQTMCQDQAAWKAYNLAQDAAFYEWDTAQRGLDVK